MLRNMTVLLYTYFFNISLNVIRPSFCNMCNLPFLSSPNIGKIRVKVRPKTNYFSYFMSSCTNTIAVFNIFFHWYVANQEKNKTMLAIFSFWIFFEYSAFDCFHGKYAFKTRRIIAIKNEQLIIRWNVGMVLCSSLLEMCVQSLKLIVWAVFVLELVKCSPPRKHSLAKFL